MDTKIEKANISKLTIDKKHVRHESKIPKPRRSLVLCYGSLYPNERKEENWKEKYQALQRENRFLREENAQQKEKILSLEQDQRRLLVINQDYFQRLVQPGNCENVQIGSHNTQVVHNNCDVSLIKDLISQLENSIKEVNEKRKLMEELMQDLTSQLKKMMEYSKISTRSYTADSEGHRQVNDMKQLTEQLAGTETACPDCSVSRISQQITDLQLKLDTFNELCASKRVSSTLSLDERKLSRNNSKCECRRHSEHNLHM
ncbi:uncharacterized protein LOC132719349 [Ruditapes philippinarum]|uniref:uncharacterized protein LOC132719349 n=1 Tax=Ruditapes philippinarum TaxID=129788 RepID=UPI00295BC7F5|nr:uncharacterized protein LOC132719349 [Ruditapes philippinarum]